MWCQVGETVSFEELLALPSVAVEPKQGTVGYLASDLNVFGSI